MVSTWTTNFYGPKVILLLFRMCRALMPGDEESMSDEAIWETLPVSYSQVA